MQTIVDTVRSLDEGFDHYHSSREEARWFYVDGLSYKEINDLKITKQKIFEYFIDPKTNAPILPSKQRISIRWCTHPEIAHHFWDKW